jgi:general secretion pathway protein M
MKDWWLGLEARERRLITVGGAAALVLVIYALILDPLLSGLSHRRQAVAEQRSTLAWMQQAVGQVAQLRSAGPRAANLGGRSLLGLVDGSAREAGLGGALKRVKPDGSTGVRVWFEGVRFDDLVGWLGRLEAQQVSVRSITLDRPGEPGRVNAQLTLEVVA